MIKQTKKRVKASRSKSNAKSIDDLKKAIDSYVRRKSAIPFFLGGYGNWYVGITSDHTQRKQKHKHPKKWKRWKATTAAAARAIEKHFLDKGMKGGGGGGDSPLFVYVY